MSWNIREQGHKGAQATGRQGSSARSWGTHKPTGEVGVWWWWVSRAGGTQSRGHPEPRGVQSLGGGVQSLGASRSWGRPELGGPEPGKSRDGGVQSWGAPRAGREQPQERGGGRRTVLSVTVEFAYNAALLLVSLLL